MYLFLEPRGQVLVRAVLQPRAAVNQRARRARREDEEDALHVPGRKESVRRIHASSQMLRNMRCSSKYLVYTKLWTIWLLRGERQKYPAVVSAKQGSDLSESVSTSTMRLNLVGAFGDPERDSVITHLR